MRVARLGLVVCKHMLEAPNYGSFLNNPLRLDGYTIMVKGTLASAFYWCLGTIIGVSVPRHLACSFYETTSCSALRIRYIEVAPGS